MKERVLMLKIGDFSKLAHVTVKTLRHYARLGLLEPVWTDRFTGYRYYTLGQLPRLNRILALKDLGFSLEQVRVMLDAQLPPAVLRQMFDQKQAELQVRLAEEQGRLQRVADRLQQIEQEGQLPALEVTVKSIPLQWIVSQRTILTDTDDLERQTAPLCRQLSSQALHAGLRTAHSWMVLHHAREFSEQGMEVEVGVLLGEVLPPGKRYPGLSVRRLAPVASMASLLHARGECPLQEAYTLLYGWAERNGYLVSGQPRQVLFDQPIELDEKPAYTELQVPVESALERKNKFLANGIRKETDMEPKIITRPAFKMVGMRYFGNNQNQEISKLWGAANQHMDKVKHVSPDWGAIGLCSMVPDAPKGEFEYVAGLVVSQVEDIPQGFVVREVPAHKYAVFTHTGSLGTLKATYEYIYQTWLPQSGYELDSNIDFEYYDEDFKDFAPDSRFYIYIPIK
jgi:predicted transcriptional regulator YdeE/DNA-binding transcriptional MerR regulator